MDSKMDSQDSSHPLFHTFILYANVGVCIFIVLSFLYFHFTWRNGRNRLPDRPRFSQASTFWNELNTSSGTNRLATNRRDKEQAKLLRISKLEDSESSAGEDSI